MEGKFTFIAERPCFLGSDSVDSCNSSSSTSLSNVQERFRQLSIGKREYSIDTGSIPSLRLAFNADAAANRLPAELVVKIFMSGAWTKWHELLSLTHICQYWRDVARGTPQLWADAVASMFKLWMGTHLHSMTRYLPTLLSWSGPCPLRLEIETWPDSTVVSILENDFIALRPHFSQLCHLSVRAVYKKDAIAVFKAARSGMPRLESLHVTIFINRPVSDEWVSLNDSGLPHLHTLSIPGDFFTSAVALKRLKSVTLHDHPRSHEVFLDALEIFSVGLESLTIKNLGHPHWVVEESTSLRAQVRLRSLRCLKVTTFHGVSPPPGLILGISFPSDVAIDIRRKEGPGDTYKFLPKHLVGLHTPPFFDAMCLFVSGSADTVNLNYFVSGAQRLSVDTPPRSARFIDDGCLSSFVWGFPNLCRLDLLGKNAIDVKLHIAKAFLDRLADPTSRTTVASAGSRSGHWSGADGGTSPYYIDESRYTVDYQIAIVPKQLDKIEALLKTHLAAGGPRLHRLELCIMIVRAGMSRDTLAVPGAPYYRVADVPPSSHWTHKLSWFFLPRFQALVDDVVFFGKPQVLSVGPWSKSMPASILTNRFFMQELAKTTKLLLSYIMPQIGTSILPHPELASPLSQGDIAALSELSDASQVRAWTRRKVAGYKQYIKALDAIHNSIAPINKLPTELLQKVFANVPFKAEWCDVSWMLSLQSVCRRWRSVLLATPEYWLRGLYTALDPYNRIRYRRGDDEDDDSDEDNDKDVRRDRRRGLVDLFLDRSAPLPLKLRVPRTSYDHSTGWETFEDHFDRVTTFEVEVDDEDDLYDAFHVVVPSMKRLESLELCIEYESDIYGEEFTLDQWKAEDLPRLGRLWTDAFLFCRAMTVPSLREITLYGCRDIGTLPGLLDALEGCPALTAIHRLYFYTEPAHSEQGEQALDRIVNLPNFRSLEILGEIPALYGFLSCLSFPSTTRVKADIDGDIGDQFALPSILPRRISGLHTSPTIDRLYIHSQHRPYRADRPQPQVSMTGFTQGVERLRVGPVFRLCRARHFLQFLDVFAACTVTELALDLGSLPNDLDAEFWTQFFAALPDVRRLELLSRTAQSRATKRAIAEPFLASARILQEAGHATSLAWVLYAGTGSTPHLEEELGDIEQVLLGHVRQGGRLKALELYITTSGPNDNYEWWKVSDVAQVTTDAVASRSVTRDYVSRLADAADTVIVGGGWGFVEDDAVNAEDRASNHKEDEEEAGSDDMQVV